MTASVINILMYKRDREKERLFFFSFLSFSNFKIEGKGNLGRKATVEERNEMSFSESEEKVSGNDDDDEQVAAAHQSHFFDPSVLTRSYQNGTDEDGNKRGGEKANYASEEVSKSFL